MRTTHRPLTTAALALSVFMAALEMTVVTTAMPTVVSDLGGIERIAWVFTAYMLASTITVPIYGKLADLYGRKPVLLFGIALFLVGSVGSGLSSSMDMLVAFRTVQGLGAGAMQPTALTVIGDIFSLQERARVQGVFSAVWGLAGLMGPFTGGLLVEKLSWHWVFFINVPFGIGAAVVLMIAFHEQIEKKRHALDFGGAALLTAGVVALLVSVQGQGRESLLAFALAVAFLSLFVMVERRVAEPVMPLGIFALPVITIAAATGALFSAAMFGATTYVPLFVQGVLHGTPTQAGGMLTPMLVCWPVSSVVAGRLISRLGFRPLIVGGFLVSAVGTVMMALVLTPGASMRIALIPMAIFGAGMGFASTALLIAVQTSVGWELRGVVTASNMFFRTVGGALGVGLMGGVLVDRLTRDPSIPVSAANALLGPDHGRNLSPEVMKTLGGALESGLTVSFWIIAGTMVAALAISLFFPKVKAGELHPGGGA
ncbi:MAG TPA: MDR family MFS transporter, partial [Longimicrobium sp.]|nr:MDR family MFS transporter [Longimicrobium sp.]